MRGIKQRIREVWTSLLYAEDKRERGRLLNEFRGLLRQVATGKKTSAFHKTHQRSDK
jgi:hypothetical protein